MSVCERLGVTMDNSNKEIFICKFTGMQLFDAKRDEAGFQNVAARCRESITLACQADLWDSCFSSESESRGVMNPFGARPGARPSSHTPPPRCSWPCRDEQGDWVGGTRAGRSLFYGVSWTTHDSLQISQAPATKGQNSTTSWLLVFQTYK